MDAPDKIYLGIIDLDSGYMIAPSFENNGGTEYIRKDALLEMLNKIKDDEGESGVTSFAYKFAIMDVIDELNSM